MYHDVKKYIIFFFYRSMVNTDSVNSYDLGGNHFSSLKNCFTGIKVFTGQYIELTKVTEQGNLQLQLLES